jgi:adenylate cyclase
VIAGRLGAHAYGIWGEVPLLAARLQSLPAQYGPSIIVAEETRAAAEHSFAFLEVDYVASDPYHPPVRLYAMLGSPQTRSSPKFRALSTFHDHIFNALRGRQWREARTLVEQCRKLSGASQALYDLYLARIHDLERNPPAENWDGAFKMALK